MTSVNTKKGHVDFKEEENDNNATISEGEEEAAGGGLFNENEDPDMNIYFTPQSLLQHIANLEEENLFKIHLVQEDEVALENCKKEIQENIKEREIEIREVRKNIENLERSRAVLAMK
jgi:hypothetical protein